MDIILYKFICQENHITVLFEEQIKDNMIVVNCKYCGHNIKIENGIKETIKDELSHLTGD